MRLGEGGESLTALQHTNVHSYNVPTNKTHTCPTYQLEYTLAALLIIQN